MARQNPEQAFQRSVAQLLDSLGWFWWHTPNGGLRDVRVARKLKAEGVKAGVADVIIFEPWIWTNDEETIHLFKNGWICKKVGRKRGSIIVMELKIAPNVLTPDQRAFLDDAEARGALNAVCYTMENVFEVCRMVRPLNGRKLTIPSPETTNVTRKGE